MLIPKKTKKEEPQALAALESSTSSISSVFVCDANIIEEKAEEVKVAKASSGKSSKKMPKNKGGLTMTSTVPDLALKVYEEQVPEGFEHLAEVIRTIPKDDYHVLAIIHNRDQVADEVFVEAIKKPHVHLLAIKQGRDKNNKPQRRKVSTILSMLGIVFRPEEDALIWAERGVERIGEICAAVAYLTHETEAAQNQGKEIYDRDEIITNLEADEVQQYREGYTRALDNKRRYTNKEQAEIAASAVATGYSGAKCWEEFEAELPFPLQKGASYELIKKRFFEGVDKRMEESPEINRLCVFIKGPPNVGKTYAARHAFDSQGLSIIQISDGGKTGKFDNIKESHDVMLVDDATIPDPLGMCDNRVCKVYRRNGNNPYWCGDTLIATSNLEFEDWAKRCHADRHTIEAMRSRFYVCQIVEDDGVNFLDCISVSKRGSEKEQQERLDRFLEFRKNFDRIIAQYNPDEINVDYSIAYKRG